MAVPKRKVSKSKSRSRRANWKLTAPAMGECPTCKAAKLSHRVCKQCGFYDGKKVVGIGGE